MKQKPEVRSFACSNDEAIPFLRLLASASDDPNIHYAFAMALADTKDESNYKEMFNNLKYASDKGLPKATSYLGDCYFYGFGTDKNPKKAIDLYICAAEMGSVYGCFSAGNELLLGKWVKPDYRQAFVYLKRAADAGDVRAINSLAIMYLYGHYVDQNWRTARRLFKKAAKMGD